MGQDRPLQNIFESVRIPLYGEDSLKPKGASVFAGTTGQMFYNCFPVIYRDPTSEQGEKWIESRSGFKADTDTSLSSILSDLTTANPMDAISFVSLTDVVVIAIYEGSTDDLFIIQYRPSDNSCVKIGQVNNVGATHNVTPFISPTIGLSELINDGTPTLGLTIWNKTYATSVAYYAVSVNGLFPANSLTLISDAEFPTNFANPINIVGKFVQMNGTTYIMGRDGKIYNSDLNSISSWNALGVKAAQTSNDRGMGLIRYKHHIVAMGEDTIEFFYDAGNAAPASPLNRQDQAYLKMGVISPSAYINIQDILYYISKDSNNNIAFWRLDGYSPVEISPAGINHLLKSGNYPHLVCMNMNGTLNIVFNNTARTLSWPVLGNLSGSDSDPIYQEMHGLLTFNLSSHAWWYFNIDIDSDAITPYMLQAIYPTTLLSQFPKHAQYFWVGLKNTGTTFSTYPLKTTFNDSGVDDEKTLWFDVIYDGTTRYRKIPVFWSTNTLDFGNEKRKRIHKYKVIATQLRAPGTSDPPFNTWNGTNNIQYLFWSNKDPVTANISGSFTASDVKVRSKDVATSSYTVHRYYASNLGSGRYLTFAFFQKLFLPMRFMCIELDMSQGTS
jgi:hypothetical protein